MTEYSIHQHKHAYATWAASRAWGRGLRGGGHKLAKRLIEEAARLQEVHGPDDLGEDVDAWLLARMQAIVDYAARHRLAGVTFGRAQKLVNIYLKTVLVCGGHEYHPRVVKLHPPLDLELFRGLSRALALQEDSAAARAFRSAQVRRKAWTQFDREDYLGHIDAIRSYMGDQPLWMVERYWR